MTAVRIRSAQTSRPHAAPEADAGGAAADATQPAARAPDPAPAPKAADVDAVWGALRDEARALAQTEPMLASLLHMVVLEHDRFEDALSFRIAQKLASPELSALLLRDMAADALLSDGEIAAAARTDVQAVYERDPSCTTHLQGLLFFKGFLALQAARVAHWYWRGGRREMAQLLQMRVSEVFGADIHPGARIGRGIMIDHATGVVIGETATVGDDVSMLHGVTLGGTGKDVGDRHPKVGAGVLIGAHASILGNITIGARSRVGAGSVVLTDVPPCTTVAGVPAKVVGDGGCSEPSRTMNQSFS